MHGKTLAPILTALGTTFKPFEAQKESQEKFLARIIKASNALDDANYNALPTASMTWLDEGVEAINKKKTIMAPLNWEDAVEPTATAVKSLQKKTAAEVLAEKAKKERERRAAKKAEEDNAKVKLPASKTKPATKVIVKAVEKHTKPGKTTEPYVTKAGSLDKRAGSRPGSAEGACRAMLCSNPDISVEEICANLASEGIPFTRSTMAFIRRSFLRVYEGLSSTGRIKITK